MAELCVFDERITNLKKLSTAIFCRRANPEYEMGMTEAFVKHYPELELTGISFRLGRTCKGTLIVSVSVYPTQNIWRILP